MTTSQPTAARKAGLLWALMAAMFVIGLDIFIVSPLLPAIATAFGVPKAQVGLLVTAFALPYGALALLFGPISDRVGRRRMLLAALPIFALASAGTALAPTFGLLVAARIIAGAAAAAFTPSLYAVVGDAVPPAERTRAMGRIMAGVTLGMVLGVPLGALVAQVLSWRGTFWLVTLLAVAVLAVLAAVLPQQAAPTTPGGTTGYRAAYRRALATPGAIPALITSFLWFGFSNGFYTFVGDLLQGRYHLTPLAAGLVLSLIGVANALGNFTTANITRRLGSPRRAVLVAVALGAVAITAIGLTPALPLAGFLALQLLLTFGGGFGLPAHQALLASLGGQVRGTLLSLGSSSMYLGLMTAAALESWAIAGGGITRAALLAGASFALAWLAEHQVGEATASPSQAPTPAKNM